MQFRERPILPDKIDNIFRPKKGAARGAVKRSRENSGIALRLTREKFRDIGVAQPGCATPHPIGWRFCSKNATYGNRTSRRGGFQPRFYWLQSGWKRRRFYFFSI
jgi:hypothetical protein